MNDSQTKNQRRMALVLILAGGLILILAALALLFQSGGSPETAAESPVQEDVPYPEVSRIPVDEAWARVDGGQAIVLDVRSEGNYQDAHIPGAISMPLGDIQVRMQELPKDSEIITYCT